MNFWNWVVKSLYNRKVIAYSRFRPVTSTIWHVLFAIFIAGIPFFFTMNVTAISGVNQLKETMRHELPPFQLIDGTLHSENDEIYLSNHESGQAIVIDSTNSFSREELSQLGNGIALTHQEILIIDQGRIQGISYSLLGIQDFSKEQLAKRISDLSGFLPILLTIATILMYAALLGLAFLGISFLGLVGLLLRGARTFLDYRHLWLMTAHALTLPVILLYWIDTLVVKVPISAFLIATFVILFIAIKSIPLPRKKSSE
ncbi:DUF1189 domain-containing protein [bacterium LRH843]|nr:DUF1189 domain-containing protein [bacterium LRH843]